MACAVTVLRQPLHGGMSDVLSSGLFVVTAIDELLAGSKVTENVGSIAPEGGGSVMAFTVIVTVPALGEVPETVGVVELSWCVVALSA